MIKFLKISKISENKKKEYGSSYFVMVRIYIPRKAYIPYL